METVTELNWWQRNWKWFVPASVLFALLLIVGFFFLVYSLVIGMMKSSEPYTVAMQLAQQHPVVQEKLGQPVEAGYFITGSISSNNLNGHAELLIPLNGPDGTANLHISADKGAGKWTYNQLYINIDNHDQTINLLDR